MAYHDIEDSRMYKRAEKVADAVWDLVDGWKYFEKKTVGDQLVRSCDSIGANLAESAGRFHKNDVIKFIYYSRGSLRETKYWIKRANARDLIDEDDHSELLKELNQLGKELNNYIGYQKSRTIKEEHLEYNIGDEE